MNCRRCKSEVQLNYTARTNRRMEKNRLCFECQYWNELSKSAHLPNSVRIEGKHYWIGREDAPMSGRGFYGELFTIIFRSGRIVHTTNLWCQGDIPVKWQRKLPNNAKFRLTPWNRKPLPKKRGRR